MGVILKVGLEQRNVPQCALSEEGAETALEGRQVVSFYPLEERIIVGQEVDAGGQFSRSLGKGRQKIVHALEQRRTKVGILAGEGTGSGVQALPDGGLPCGRLIEAQCRSACEAVEFYEPRG